MPWTVCVSSYPALFIAKWFRWRKLIVKRCRWFMVCAKWCEEFCQPGFLVSDSTIIERKPGFIIALQWKWAINFLNTHFSCIKCYIPDIFRKNNLQFPSKVSISHWMNAFTITHFSIFLHISFQNTQDFFKWLITLFLEDQLVFMKVFFGFETESAPDKGLTEIGRFININDYIVTELFV